MNLIASGNNGLAQFGVFVTVLIAVGVLVAVSELVACILNTIVWFKTHRANKTNNENQIDGETSARKLLDNMGLSNVKVQQAGFFRALFYGDYYNAKTKTVYLRKRVMQNKSVRAVATAVLNVVYAEYDKNGDKAYAKRFKMQPFVLLAPYMFVPLFLVGLIIDLVTLQSVGVGTLVLTLIGLAYYLFALIYYISTIPLTKKAMGRALEIMAQTNILNENEILMVQDLYKYTITADIANMILAIVYLVQYLLKLIAFFCKKK